ncbi:hypothetical protein B0T18DRAFT_107600 [Schizothecium vesticola]|uniref:Uncharacterized protein n=1 Tax=Schizothecium vesticola TaxID=314040 RepID=A0AA40K846_9PEZI|nr:hypothetical protein B0T18DRAFT_107600 [Schizothecium vesticola]
MLSGEGLKMLGVRLAGSCKYGGTCHTLCTVTSAKGILLVRFDPSSSLGFWGWCMSAFLARQSGLCLVFNSWQCRCLSGVAGLYSAAEVAFPFCPVRTEPCRGRRCEFSCLRVGSGVNLDIAVLPYATTVVAAAGSGAASPLNTPRTHVLFNNHHELCCRSCRADREGGAFRHPRHGDYHVVGSLAALSINICLAVGDDDDNVPDAGMFHARRPGARKHLWVSCLDVLCQSGRVMDAGPSTERKHQRPTEGRDENLTMQGNHSDREATNLLTGRELSKRGGGYEKGGRGVMDEGTPSLTRRHAGFFWAYLRVWCVCVPAVVLSFNPASRRGRRESGR